MPVQIPNKDAYTRIEGLRSGLVLAVVDDKLCHVKKDPIRFEQFWQIVPSGPSVLPGTYQYIIKNVTTGRVIWCRTKKERAGVIDGDGKYNDNHFIFDETNMSAANGTVRIFCPSTNCVLVSRTERKPEIDGFEVSSDRKPDFEDHHFRFLFEEMIDPDIQYDTESAKFSEEGPIGIGHEEFQNQGELQEVKDLVWDKTITEEHSFERSEGSEQEIEVGLKINMVPEIVDGDVRLRKTTKQDFKFGDKNAEELKFGTTLHLAVPPGKTYTAKLSTTKVTVSMPYTIKATGKYSKAKLESKGTYKGIEYRFSTLVQDIEDSAYSKVYKHSDDCKKPQAPGGSPKENRSFEPQEEEAQVEENETYENRRYDEFSNFQENEQQEEYPEGEQITSNGFDENDVDNQPSEQSYADERWNQTEENPEEERTYQNEYVENNGGNMISAQEYEYNGSNNNENNPEEEGIYRSGYDENDGGNPSSVQQQEENEDVNNADENPDEEPVYRNRFDENYVGNSSFAQQYNNNDLNGAEPQNAYPSYNGEYGQTESYNADVSRDYAYRMKNGEEQELRRGNNYNDNGDYYPESQNYNYEGRGYYNGNN